MLPDDFVAFTTRSDRGRELRNVVDIAEPFDTAWPAAEVQWKPFLAVWDTGATHTYITKDVALQCGLASTGDVKVSTAAGPVTANTYSASIRLLGGIVVPHLRVAEATLDDGGVLVGMDIITQGDLAVSQDQGETVFSFRVPSLGPIDFVKQAEAVENSKLSRNQPCPCGSGKKYKHCHGKA